MDHLKHIENKVIEPEHLNRLLSLWRFSGEKIVFTNGCFDVLHLGHLKYLATAAGLGTKLIIGLNTDESVRKLKGAERPVNPQEARALLLAGFQFVDAIVYFGEETPINLIKTIEPDVLVKGGDYKAEEVVGYQVVTEKGGEVVIIDFVDGFSSTAIIKKSGLV
jgi:rfaE bifunctional protein nucleotidyltransferase chain/domain